MHMHECRLDHCRVKRAHPVTQPIATTTRVCQKKGNLLRIDLQPCWYPDIEDTDVDNCDKNRSTDHDQSRTPPVRDDDTDSVDDDLQEELNLDTPPEQDGEVKSKTCNLVSMRSKTYMPLLPTWSYILEQV
jgi:hypothetical protein